MSVIILDTHFFTIFFSIALKVSRSFNINAFVKIIIKNAVKFNIAIQSALAKSGKGHEKTILWDKKSNSKYRSLLIFRNIIILILKHITFNYMEQSLD